jgi:S-adenosylmethionine:tRNA ribosyltransferase-isomerase
LALLVATPFLFLPKAVRKLRLGERLEFEGIHAEVSELPAEGPLALDFPSDFDVEAWCERAGAVPLPPYIRRDEVQSDIERYQTVFGSELGSAAAPTAALHLTAAHLARLRARGVEVVTVTLHVGTGTFLPVRCARLEDHPMHHEAFRVGPEVVAAVRAARLRGGAVVAVGTTVVRALESATDPNLRGEVRSLERDTSLLIAPGYQFRVVDALLTNFHAPRSTLIALVAAFIGQRRLFDAYAAALSQGFRFLSYGDAMWAPTCVAALEAGQT